MNEIEKPSSNDNDTQTFDKSWALKQNLFKDFEPNIVQQSNYLKTIENDLENNIGYQNEYNNLRFSFDQDLKYEDTYGEMRYSFYDNLLHKFSEENQKLKKKKHKKNILKKRESICADDEKEVKNNVKKKNILLLNKEDSSYNVSPKLKHDKKEVKFHIDLPTIPVTKNNSDNKLNSSPLVKNLPTKNEIEKSHQTVCVGNIKRKNSNSNHISPKNVITQKKNEANSSVYLEHSQYKKDISIHTSKKFSEAESKEKKLKQNPSKKNLNLIMAKEKESPVLYKPQTKFSKKSINSKISKNSKNFVSGELNAINVGNNENVINNQLISKGEEKKKSNKLFGILSCLPFCR